MVWQLCHSVMVSFLEFFSLLLLKGRTRSRTGSSSLLRSLSPLKPWGHFHRQNIQCSPPLASPSIELRIISEHRCGLKVITFREERKWLLSSCQARKERFQFTICNKDLESCSFYCLSHWMVGSLFCLEIRENVLTLDFEAKVFHQHTRVWWYKYTCCIKSLPVAPDQLLLPLVGVCVCVGGHLILVRSCLLQDIDEFRFPSTKSANLFQDKIIRVPRSLRLVMCLMKGDCRFSDEISLCRMESGRGVVKMGGAQGVDLKNYGNESSKKVVSEKVRGSRARAVSNSWIRLPGK